MQSALRAALVIAVLAALMALPVSAEPSGRWTDNCEDTAWYTNYPSSPSFTIATPQRLASVAKLVNEGATEFEDQILEISADIDLSAHFWVPIGTPEHPFKGTIRSTGGKTITGIAVATDSAVEQGGTRYYGLVGCALGATVTNLTLDGTITVIGADGKTDVVGAAIAVAGANAGAYSEVSKLTSKIKVVASGTDGTVTIGGIVGESAGAKLSGCVNGPKNAYDAVLGGTIIVNGAANATVGGMIGEVSGATTLAGNGGGGALGEGGASSGPSRNNAALNVTADDAVVGGIIGKISAGTLAMTTRETDKSQNPEEYARYIWSMGDLTVTPATNADVGGFIGAITGTGECDLQDASFIGNIRVKNENSSFTEHVGGILGVQNASAESSLTNCRFTTGLKVTSNNAVLIDERNQTPKILVSSVGEGYTGGIYGYAERLTVASPMVGSAEDVPGNPVIQATGSVGGIGGYSAAGAAYVTGTACITNLTVTGIDHSGSVGGAFGTVSGLEAFELSAEQLDVTCQQAGSDIGGVIGTMDGDATDGAIHVVGSIRVSSTGNDCNIGGFVGQNAGTLKNISLGDRTSVICSKGSGCSMGGFAGKNTGDIDYCYSAAELATISSSTKMTNNLSLGGLVGTNTGTVQNCYRDLDVTAVSTTTNADTCIGGLIGRNTGSAGTARVRTCYAACNVDASGITNGTAYVGGLIGFLEYGTVENCYTAADHTVSGGTAGGFIGQRDPTTAVQNCYAAASVTGGTKGGFFGTFIGSDTGNVAHCAYRIDGELPGAGGASPSWTDESLTPMEQNAFSALCDDADWDFDHTWRVSALDGYPVLLRASDGTTLNYDIRWYAADPDADSFTIAGEAELSGLALLVNGDIAAFGAVDFAGQTITLSGAFAIQTAEWVSIGKSGAPFSGSFDGNNQRIDGLRMTGVTDTGLFGVTGTEALLNNVSLNTLTLSGSGNVGTLAAVNHGTITAPDIILGAAIAPTANSAGGVVGTNSGTITAASVTLNQPIAAAKYAGGVAGTNSGEIDAPGVTFADGVCVSAATAAGGVTGTNSGTVTNPAYTFEGDGAFVMSSVAGGVAGVNEAAGVVSAADLTLGRPIEATGTNGCVGGVAGRNAGTIRDTAVTLRAAVSATDTAGGVAGRDTGSITGSTVGGDGTVSAAAYAGGMVGRLTADGTITASTTRDITVTGVGSVGGVVGGAFGTLQDSRAGLDDVTVISVTVVGDGAANVGGVLGCADGATAANLTVSGVTVNAEPTAAANVGGVAGLAENSILRSVNAQAFAVTVAATGADVCVGGVAGRLTVADEYKNMTCTLTAEDKLGAYPGVTDAHVSELAIRVTGDGTKNALAGGVVGQSEQGSVYDSSVSGGVSVSGFAAICAGGAAGHAVNACLVNNTAGCDIALRDALAYDAGGFVGKLEDSTARYNRVFTTDLVSVEHGDAAMNAPANVGGFAGRIQNAKGWAVRENRAAQPVGVTSESSDAEIYAGGFAGQIDGSDTTVLACYATGSCTISAAASGCDGGFVGKLANGTVASCYASGNLVSVSARDAYSGGFAGTVASGEIRDCYAVDGTIMATGTSSANAGAFAGSVTGTIDAVYASVSSVLAKVGIKSAQGGDRLVIVPAQESGVTLNVGTHLAGFDFDTADRAWCYLSGRNANRPVLTALESWDSVPELTILREQGLETLTVSSADELGVAAKLLGDESFAKLFTNGRTARGGMTVKLAENIKLNGKLWEPIRELASGDTLDGEKHTISGMSSDAATYDNFGFVRVNNGTIRNLTIAGAAVTAGKSAGLAAGTNAGVMENVTVTGSTLTGTGAAGGAAGTNSGTMSDITVASDTVVKGKTAGGIAGVNSGTIQSSATAAKAAYSGEEEASVVGGAAGTNTGTLRAITSTATVTGGTAGGIAGDNSGGGTIEGKTVSTAAVTGGVTGGGVAGSNGGTVGAASNGKGDVISNATVQAPTVGGVVGTNSGTVRNSDWIGTDSQLRGGETSRGQITASGGYDNTCRASQCAAPTASPVNRMFTDKVTVSLSTDTEGATIHYTTDGTEPTGASKQYTAAFELTATTTVKAIALKDDHADSGVLTVTYSKSTPGGGGGAALPVTVVDPPDSDCPMEQFPDLKHDEWYHDGIHWALENGVMNGYDSGVFAPNDSTSRAMIAVMLWRLEGSETVSYEMSYSDVPNGWYTEGVRWASAKGIVTGGTDGRYAPNDAVTREQIATLLYRYARFKGRDVSAVAELSGYGDAANANPYAIPALRWACAEGIITGATDSSGTIVLAPQDACARAVVATILMRFCEGAEK